jgi:hypothetical protein
MLRMLMALVIAGVPAFALADDKPAGDKKLAELEAKLQSLLKEIQTLRALPSASSKKDEKKSIVLELETGKKGEKGGVELKLAQPKKTEKKDVVVEVNPKTKVSEGKDVIVEVVPGQKKVENKDVIVRIGPDGKAIAEWRETIDGKTIERKIVAADGKGVVGLMPKGEFKVVDKLILGADGKPMPGIKAGPDGKTIVWLDEKTKPHVIDVAGVPSQGTIRSWVAQPSVGAYGVAGHDPNTVHLTRVTYSLTAEQAKALDAFLKSFVKASVMETKVEGEKIVITTTPDAQATIGQVVALMSGKPAGGALYRLAVPAGAATPAKVKEPAKTKEPAKP